MYIKAIEANDNDFGQLFSSSLYETGFAVLRGVSLGADDLDVVYSLWEQFLRLSASDKVKFAYDSQSFDGWISINDSETAVGSTIKDFKEFYHFNSNYRCSDFLLEETRSFYHSQLDLGLGFCRC